MTKFALLVVILAIAHQAAASYILDQVTARAQEKQAHRLVACLQQVDALQLDQASHNKADEASRCVCKWKNEVADNAYRLKGLERACRRMEPLPKLNPYETGFDLRAYCQSTGSHANWPVCAMF